MFSRAGNQIIKIKGQPLLLIRAYAGGRPEVKAALPQRPSKVIRTGKARPAIYHKFNAYIELSDGSVIKRRTQYPKDEIRMITDQRNNPLWNSSKPDVSLLDAEAKGKLNKFNTKYAQFEQSGKTEEQILAEKQKAENERKLRLETGFAAKIPEEETSDDYLDILGSNYVEKKLGGNLAQKDKGKKKR